MARDSNEVDDWIKSMEQRINSQKQVLNAIKKQRNLQGNSVATTTLF